MSKTAKIVIAVIVIAAIAYGIYRWKSKQAEEAKVIPIQGTDKAAA